MILNNLGAIAAAVRKSITDTFVRSNSADINNPGSVDGSKWDILRGSWNISGNRGTTSSQPTSPTQTSNMPLIVQEIPFENVDILQRSPQPGTSSALWVTDANNWWAVGIETTSITCNCVTSACCGLYGCTTYGCTTRGCTATGCTAFGCTTYGCSTTGCTGYGCTETGCTKSGCTTYGCVSSFTYCSRFVCTTYGCRSYYRERGFTYCSSYGCTKFECETLLARCDVRGCTKYGCLTFGCTKTGCTSTGCTAFGCTATGCTATGCTTYGCTAFGCTANGCVFTTTCTTCQTCYPKYIRVFQSIANQITTLATWFIGETLIGSFRVKTNNNIITAQSYDDVNGLVRQGAEFSYDATSRSPVKTTKFGLVITPANYNQGNSSGGIVINSNS
jgi:hypothetical protein